MEFYELANDIAAYAPTHLTPSDYIKIYHDELKCVICGRMPFGVDYMEWGRPRITSLVGGKQVKDFIYGVPPLASQKVKDMFEQYKLIGDPNFEIIDNILYRGKPIIETIGNYYLFKPKVSRVCIDWSKTLSNAEYSKKYLYCDRCKIPPSVIASNYKDGIVLDLTHYEGEDIFRLGSPNKIIVSQNFVNACQSNGITNIFPISLSTYTNLYSCNDLDELHFGVK